MSFHYLPALVAGCSEPTSSDGAPSAPWKSSRTAEKSCCGASGTVCCPCSQSGMTSEPSTADRGVASWMSSLAASRASRSPSPARGSESTIPAICGPTPSASSVRWSPDIAYWRTSQGSLLTNTLERFSGTWWRAGFASDGIASPLPPLAPLTGGTGSGSWPSPQAHDAKGARSEASAVRKNSRCLARESRWQTPRVTTGDYTRDNGVKGRERLSLHGQVKQWPTPSANEDAAGRPGAKMQPMLGNHPLIRGGNPTPQMTLNPAWVELLMGWPHQWTSLDPISHTEYNKWLGGFLNVKENYGTSEEVPQLRMPDEPQEVQREAGKQLDFQEKEVLRPVVRERPQGCNGIGVDAESEKDDGSLMCIMRSHDGVAGSSLRRGQEEPIIVQPPDPLRPLPQVSPRYGKEAWLDGSWEDGVPRVERGIACRVDRLKALGNGQVPAVVRKAWEALAT